MRVLIADDEPVSRRLLQSYLQKWGFEVDAAADGADAWRRFEAADYPVVITDWMMPEVDGVTLVRRIRAAHRPSYVYVILLTARAQKEDLVEGMEAGADDFLTKPFDRDELRVRLRAAERIIRLEHNLAAAGRRAADAARDLDAPLADAAAELDAVRRETAADPVREAVARAADRVRRARDLVRALRDPPAP